MAWPILDTVAAIGLAALTVQAYTHRDDKDGSVVAVFPLAGYAGVTVGSAIYGYVAPGRCERRAARADHVAPSSAYPLPRLDAPHSTSPPRPSSKYSPTLVNASDSSPSERAAM
jgi:hypothetical protein